MEKCVFAHISCLRCAVQTLSSALGPLPSTLGSLAPLRGLDVLGPGPVPSANPPLRGSLGGTPSSGGLEPLKTSLGVRLPIFGQMSTSEL